MQDCPLVANISSHVHKGSVFYVNIFGLCLVISVYILFSECFKESLCLKSDMLVGFMWRH